MVERLLAKEEVAGSSPVFRSLFLGYNACVKTKIVFLFILFLGVFLRFYRLGEVPTGLSQDETSLGYNAYSILKTGKDEHGVAWPSNFKAFGEYKLPGYIYLSVPTIAVFGPTPMGVRLPSAIAGVLTIFGLYLLVKKFSQDKNLALIASFLLAINPWHVHFSRAAFEVVPALLFIIWGVYLWHLALEKGKRRLVYFGLGAVLLVLSMHTYNICKLFTPLLAGWFLWQERKNLPWKNKQLYASAVPALLLLVPFVSETLFGSGYGSTTGTLLHSSPVIQAEILEKRMAVMAEKPWLSKLFYNQYFQTVYVFGQHIAEYISGKFFFAHGSDHGNHGLGDMGTFYLWEIISICIGAVALVRKTPRYTKLLIGWIILNILVAAYTRETPHGTRAFFLLAPLAVLSAYGLQTAWREILKPAWRMPAAISSACILVVSLGYFLTNYFYYFPTFYAESWHDQDKYLIEYLRGQGYLFDQIIFDKNAVGGFLSSSIAYNLPIDPLIWQETAVYSADDREGFSFVASVDTYRFVNVEFGELQRQKLGKVLVITKSEKLPPELSPTWRVYYPAYEEVGSERGIIYQFGEKKVEAFTAVELDLSN